jgi:squalene-associated FAD-dependent desaturase
MASSTDKGRKPQRIAVIGAGWAGCAAAVTLARAGRQVSLFESARTLGGRARCVEHAGQRLDNGQHILLGAYRATLKMLKTVGIDSERMLLRLPLQMRYPAATDGMDFLAPRLPAPWHLALALWRAKGLTRADKLALARFSTTARWMGWQLHDDCSVATLLERFDQTERLTRLMWTPLCIAALNTPPQRASAQVFLNVLRDSLGARRAASDMLIPRTDLSQLFPDRAAALIQQHGGSVSMGRTATAIDADRAASWRIHFQQEEQPHHFDAVIVATTAEAAAGLLDQIIDSTPLRAFEYESITTCYLQYAPSTRLPLPFYALPDDPQQAMWGQFVFDRGQLRTDQSEAGLLAVVVSASAAALAQGQTALASSIACQLAQQLQQPALQTPLWSKLIADKRATFSCTPGLVRPDNTGMPAGLALAGDYLASDYPATLEAAVQSGVAAAQRLLQA